MIRNLIRKALGMLGDLLCVVVLFCTVCAWCMFIARVLWCLFKDITS